MKRFLLKFSIFISLIAVVMVVINFYVDSANLFRDGVAEKQAATLLAQRHMVTGFINGDERLFNKYYAQHSLSIKANHLVLGSSRAMLIDKNFADSSHLFYNSSVSNATLEDVMALYYIWENSGARIEKITLEVSPSWFNEEFTAPISRWKSISVEYNDFVGRLGLDGNTGFVGFNVLNSKYVQLLSPTYFKSSIRELRHKKSSAKISVADSAETNNIKYPDGSIRYPLRLYNSNNITEKETFQWFRERGFNFDQLSAQKMLYFNRFVTYLTSRNIEVELFVNVFHPQLYDMLAKKYKGLSLVEDFLQSTANDNPLVTFKGSYNPHVYNLSGSDFLDIAHPLKSVYETILRERCAELKSKNFGLM